VNRAPEEIIRCVDFDENGEINYSEFVSSTLDRSLVSEGNLRKVYSYLSGDGKVLTHRSLKSAFQRRGDLNFTRFTQMMKEIGFD